MPDDPCGGNDMPSQDLRVCQRGWAGRPWARNPKTPHFYWLALGQPGHPKPSLLSTKAWAGPAPQTPHFYRRAWAGPAHLNPSLLWTGPGQPNPSLLLARPLASISQNRPRNPARGNPTAKRHASGMATPYLPRFGALPIRQTLRCSGSRPA